MVHPKIKTTAEFVPARWWEAIDYIRIDMEMMRYSSDYWADKMRAEPYSLSTWLEYGYILDNFLHSDNFFVVVSGERAGVVSLRNAPHFVYLEAAGLLPKFQRGSIGRQVGGFIWDYGLRTKHQWAVGQPSIHNKPVHMLFAVFGGRTLGLSTTLLTLKTTRPSPPLSELEIKPLKRSDANKAWKRWRLHEVEQVSGDEGTELASYLLERLPWWSKYLALYQDGAEIGLAVAHQHKGEASLGLFPSQEFWSSAPTASLVAAVARHLGTSIRHLKLTQTHANALTSSDSFDFERNKQEERHFVFFKRV